MNKSIFKSVICLTVIGTLSAAVLMLANIFLKPEPVPFKVTPKLISAMKNDFDAAQFSVINIDGITNDGTVLAVLRVTEGGGAGDYVVISAAPGNRDSLITVLTSFRGDKVNNLVLYDYNKTSNNYVEANKEPSVRFEAFKTAYIGADAVKAVKVTEVSGATYSSNGIANAVNGAIKFYGANKGAIMSAPDERYYGENMGEAG